ncbi:hypothetical protein ACOI1H_13500 [Loktanella sp. DJP18]|uniref:hypothetical protein n=1 Tax=Loktanella sp. DJP18 TaxID=3409788 RepID=UPI003BB508AC
MIPRNEMSDAASTAAVYYRRAEAHMTATVPVDGTVKLWMSQDPDLAASVQSAWMSVTTQINAHFSQAVPTTKRSRARGDGPLVFEFHHTVEVARECYLLELHDQIQAGSAVTPRDAADYTLRRIGITGDPEAFFLQTEQAA